MHMKIQYGGNAIVTLEKAEKLLRDQLGDEYVWLLDSDLVFFTIPEVARHARMDEYAIRLRCESGEIPGSVRHGGKTGWRIPRSGLILYFASRLHGVQ